MKSKAKLILKLLLTFSILSAAVREIAAVANPTTTDRLHRVSESDDSLYVQEILRASKAAEIQSYMDESIAPCDDFYEFACSKFPKYHPSRAGVASNMLQIMADALKDKIAKFLNTPETVRDSKVEGSIKRFYISCMKIKDLTPAGYKSKLLTLISEFGMMPVLSDNKNWFENDFDWIAMVAKMRRQFAKPALLQLDVAPDFQDGSVNCLYVGQPKMLLDTKAMYNDSSTEHYRDLMKKNIAQQLETFLGVPRELARRTATEIMYFEILLSQGMWEGKVEPEKMYLPTTVQALHTKYDLVIDVERLINLTVGQVSTACLYESVESFQMNLRQMLPKVPKHIVANYLFYMLLREDFWVRSASTEKEQSAICQAKVTGYFNKVLDNMVYREYDTKKSEIDIKLIYAQLKSVLQRKFAGNELDWMKPKARHNALEKLERTRFEINSHEHDNATNEFIDLKVTSIDYLENVKNLLLLRGRKFVQSVYELPRPLDAAALLSFSPANLIQENKIVIPVAFLQPYYLWADVYPNSIKFGSLGTTLAHELLHSFDDEGRKYDKHGKQRNWWDLDSMQNFNERKKCLVEQYSKYQFGDNYLRGDYVLSENIADNGGLKLAYDAYMLWLGNANHTAADIKRETLTQLKYTPTQLFFLSFAQLWCTDMNDEMRNLQVATDTHAPSYFRIIGTLQNSVEFSAAFKCPVGSYMNPVYKCNVY